MVAWAIATVLVNGVQPMRRLGKYRTDLPQTINARLRQIRITSLFMKHC